MTHAHACYFTPSAKDSPDLVRAQGDRLLVHAAAARAEAPLEVSINGRISHFIPFSPRDASATDRLLVFTEKKHALVLACASDGESVVTLSSGDVSDDVGRENFPNVADIDPSSRFAAVVLYEGIVKILPLNADGSLVEAYNARLSELAVYGLCFLHIPSNNGVLLAALHSDVEYTRPIRLYELLPNERTLRDSMSLMPTADDSEHIMPVPQPTGGLLVVGQNRITYISGGTIAPTPSTSAEESADTGGRTSAPADAGEPTASTGRMPSDHSAHARIPCLQVCSVANADSSGLRYLLSDHEGKLVLVTLSQQSNTLTKQLPHLQVTVLGDATPARALASLGNGVVFLGSLFGDNQLVSISDSEISEQGSMVSLIESYSNLAPIQDLTMVDIEKQGQGQAITCSGAFNHGSLRIVRNGIGVNELASLPELEGTKGIFSMKQSSSSEFHSHLAISFISETKVLAMDEDEELAESELPGLDSNASTIALQTVANDLALQVTASSVNLFSAPRGSVSTWSPSSRISVAAINDTQVLLGTGSPALVLLDVSSASINELHSIMLASEASSVDCTPLSTKASSTDTSGLAGGASLGAVGFWDHSVALYSLPSLQQLTSVNVEQDSVPRSVLLRDFESIAYLLVGLGDGNLLTLQLLMGGNATADIDFGQRKRVSLGTQPLKLTPLTTKGMRSAFVSSDRPTIVHSSSGKLLYSNVNMPEVMYVSPFNHQSVFPDSLALVGSNALTIGNIDEIQRLHVRTVPLYEQPRRIAHQEETRSVCVLTKRITSNPSAPTNSSIAGARQERMDTDANATADDEDHEEADIEEGFVRLFDDQTYELTSSFALDRNEHPFSLISCQLGEASTNTPRFVAGTVFVESGEFESGRGRILIFSVLEGKKLRLEHALDAEGEVFVLAPFQRMLLAGVNTRVDLYSVKEARGVQRQCYYDGHIHVVSLQTRGGFVAVGDMMRSVSLLLYDSERGAFEERARDFNPLHITSLNMIDDDNVLASENFFNLFTVHKNTDAATDEERMRLEVTGEYHLGDLVNTFKDGSLTMDLPDSEVAGLKTCVFGTVSGALGVIAQITKQQFDFLCNVQDAMREKVKTVGGLLHSHYRGFLRSSGYEKDSRNFIDGDFVESYLELSRDKQEAIAEAANLDADDIIHRLEDFSRLH